MHRTEDDNHVNNQFSNNPPATIIGDTWLNAVQEEICNVIEAAGIQVESEDTDTNKNQMLTAILALLREPAGIIKAYGGTTAPTGYLLCNGAAVSRSTYYDLFIAIGTAYGVGDGSTTFNVPNGQGVVLKGTGNQTINARVKSGPALGAVEEDQMQGHWHELRGNANDESRAAGSHSTNGVVNLVGNNYVQNPVTDTINGTPRTGATTRENSLGVNYIIKT